MHRQTAVDYPFIEDHSAAPAWAAARARLSLYLQTLELPEPEAARLCEQAVEAARARGGEPLPAAMAALHELLAERVPPAPTAMRPLHRGPMVPAAFDRSPLRFLADDVLLPLAAGAHGLLLGRRRRHGLLGVAAVAGVTALIGRVG